ncbi:hypothetical protein F1D05_10805 [Kribbella qitaiheensis]|uniref:Resolvase/invertase-type recombinase catalytic domain-containing protein n=1 Tax=Kribbella qitaiheensis TaxID=1544730 RepID=A0A7G6WWC7_9ACTN|nr:hypothetical protein [Kribbella qitaiheensis]QNE18292.1 hypothetical protein F1D05_10805 [Kribbella qitaiheensis]
MADLTRPDLFGYFTVKDSLASAKAKAGCRRQLISFANREGYELKGIFTDLHSTGRARLDALVVKARRDEVKTVAVLEGTDIPQVYAEQFVEAGIVVLTVPPSPP